MSDASPRESVPYRRVVLKISGNSLAAEGGRGISMAHVVQVARQIHRAAESGVQTVVVVGGGNILRGATFSSEAGAIQTANAHYMGMLATVTNSIALQDAFESIGADSRLMSALRMDAVCEAYFRRPALGHLKKGRIVIVAAGTGGPFVTTDTAAALRALELNAEVVFKATRVDGVYSDDPEKNPNATFFPHLSYEQFAHRNLRVLDATALAHCRENGMPIVVFNFQTEGNIERAFRGEAIGTRIDGRTEVSGGV